VKMRDKILNRNDERRKESLKLPIGTGKPVMKSIMLGDKWRASQNDLRPGCRGQI